MINYVLLVVTLICTAFNIWLAVTLHSCESDYNKGLEDGIRMTNEVIAEESEKTEVNR